MCDLWLHCDINSAKKFRTMLHYVALIKYIQLIIHYKINIASSLLTIYHNFLICFRIYFLVLIIKQLYKFVNYLFQKNGNIVAYSIQLYIFQNLLKEMMKISEFDERNDEIFSINIIIYFSKMKSILQK